MRIRQIKRYYICRCVCAVSSSSSFAFRRCVLDVGACVSVAFIPISNLSVVFFPFCINFGFVIFEVHLKNWHLIAACRILKYTIFGYWHHTASIRNIGFWGLLRLITHITHTHSRYWVVVLVVKCSQDWFGGKNIVVWRRRRLMTPPVMMMMVTMLCEPIRTEWNVYVATIIAMMLYSKRKLAKNKWHSSSHSHIS